jgi:O-acetyl-ADP-ribose deacetylase (regulator of RNase III)
MNIVKGDLIQMALQGQFDAIVHGCNCFCSMSGGIAYQIGRFFPKAEVADGKTWKGDSNKLGHCQYVRVSPNLLVVNAYTQYEPGKHLDIAALTDCLYDIRLNLHMCRIGLPKIGCGIAGGDWRVVSQMIERCLQGLNYTIVEYVLAGSK